MNNDLISREALKKSIKSYADDQYAENEYLGEYAIMNIIDNAPTVEPRIEYGTDGQPYRLFMSGGQVVPDMLQGWRYEERPYGEWIIEHDWVHCSSCSHEQNYPSNFCSKCGAEMRKEEGK